MKKVLALVLAASMILSLAACGGSKSGSQPAEGTTAAAASALIYVGVIMMSNVTQVDFKKVKNAIPAFMTIIIMVLSYSITKGIGMGIITYVVLDLVIYFSDLIAYKLGAIDKKPHTDVSLVTIIVFILFLIYFLVPTIL